tara:strand:- start:6363 stop:6701 length:339 start_codon:yes stop_codon:yes gene_type:complete
MGRRINLGSNRVMPLKERIRKRDDEERGHVLERIPSSLVAKQCSLRPTSAKTVAKVIRMDNGYSFTEYKSLAKLSIALDRGRGRCKRVTLSNIYEVTEIVYSGVEPDDLEYD